MKKVIIIGGGLGGLSAAISMAQLGYSVELFEKNHHLGGKLNRLEQDGFGFDLGPSILTMPHIFERLFANSGKRMEDYISIYQLSHEWRSFFTDGTTIDLYNNPDKMLKQNPSLTERDIKEYKSFLQYAKQIDDITTKGYFDKGLDTTWEIIQEHGMIQSLKKFDLTSTMYEGIEKRITNPKLRSMLAYFIKYVGSSPYDAPAVLNMLIYMQHAYGAWYVPGGMHKIAEGLVKLANELDVQIHTNSEVTKLKKDSTGNVIAATLADDSEIKGDIFISNMEVIPTYEKLLMEKSSYIKKLTKKYEPSSSGLVLHLGVKNSYPQLSHHNFFFSHNLKEQMNQVFHKHQLPDDPTIYLVNTNKTDPNQVPGPGYENIKILPHIPYIQDKPFSDDDYKQFREQVLIKLENMGMHGLRESIVTEDMWTPNDIQSTYYSYKGSIYGTLSNKKINRGFKHPKQSSKYDNLFFVGGSVNPGGGMPMVVLSGQQVSEKIHQIFS
ncbi:phytoene dehydrogenase [Oceanobacillus iheyensis HTE831]|uniref:4,4'-diaponeurosporene oxygenase n=1 Tax=Oceanobacillus iheyensis (strain DSM 14371 / CIP 107618 / JCM 11309 / KCTC 3954 / HTE831) TaxID=221109 RepID=Q8ENM2_OCEIH|nr:phytoene dehydrogenase [Oceanobacillus iheyensis HTE831]